MPKDKPKESKSLVHTLYGCDEKGMPRLTYKGFRIIDKIYKDPLRDNIKLRKEIDEKLKKRKERRIEVVKMINKKTFTVVNVVTNETFIVTNFKRFCEERGLGGATLIEQYEGRLLGKKLAPHRDFIVTYRGWSNVS